MIIGGVKITLIICITILVSCVLLISYNEYTNRYSIIPTNDNNVYIFDKKSTVLNKCGEKGCELIETKLPSKISFIGEKSFSPSKMFNSEKSMRDEIVKTEATPEKADSEKNDQEIKKLKKEKNRHRRKTRN